MEFKTILFYSFAAILVFAALRVITAKNPVHAALYLVLSFFSSAAIWILLKAEFLALVLMLVYVGAVMVLFIFVVMMLDVKLTDIRVKFRQNLSVALFVGILIVFEISAVVMRGFLTIESPDSPASDNIGLTRELGRVLYTEYLYAFEVAAMVLLVAIVSAVALTLRRRSDVKYTSAGAAMRVQKSDRIRLVDMKEEAETEKKWK